MSVVVAYKYVANPQDASVDSDGVIDWSRAKPAVSEDDPVAITLAAELAEQMGTELVGVTVGQAAASSSMAKKTAMSKGLDRGVIVADDTTADWNHTKVASALADLVTKVGDASIVFTGGASVDHGAGLMSGLIAGYLGWPAFQEVEKVTKTNDGFEIVQSVPGGSRTVEVTGPVVVAAATDAVTPKVASMKEILAAGKKPVEVIELSQVKAAEAEVNVTATAKPEPRARKNKIVSSAQELADALKTDGIL